jgi:hypothetical protein
MIEHLEGEHGIAKDFARATTRRCHISRNNQYRFWCGFCGKVQELKNTTGVEAWDERFNHIDEHYKVGMSVDDWVDDQTHCPKSEMSKGAPKRKRKDQQDNFDFSASIPGPSSSSYMPQAPNPHKRQRSLSTGSTGPAAQRPRLSPEPSHGAKYTDQAVWSCVSYLGVFWA